MTDYKFQSYIDYALKNVEIVEEEKEVEKQLTVGELRAALEGIPDELLVEFGSDTCEGEDIIISMARRVKYELPDGRRFEDTGETGVDYFQIYGNCREDEDDEW